MRDETPYTPKGGINDMPWPIVLLILIIPIVFTITTEGGLLRLTASEAYAISVLSVAIDPPKLPITQELFYTIYVILLIITLILIMADIFGWPESIKKYLIH